MTWLRLPRKGHQTSDFQTTVFYAALCYLNWLKQGLCLYFQPLRYPKSLCVLMFFTGDSASICTVPLPFEQHGFEWQGSTYMWIFKISIQSALCILRFLIHGFSHLWIKNSAFKPQLGIWGCGRLIVCVVLRHFMWRTWASGFGIGGGLGGSWTQSPANIEGWLVFMT